MKEGQFFKNIISKKLEENNLNETYKKLIKDNILSKNQIISSNPITNKKMYEITYFKNLIGNIDKELLYNLNSLTSKVLNKVTTFNINKSNNIEKIIYEEKINFVKETYTWGFNKNWKNEMKYIKNYEKRLEILENEKYLMERKQEKIELKRKMKERKKIENWKFEKEMKKSQEKFEKRKQEIKDKEILKHEKLLKLIKNLEEKKKEKNEEIKKYNKNYLEIWNKKPLYVKLIEESNKFYKIKKDNIFKIKKEKFKKMDFNALLQHQNHIDQDITYKRGYKLPRNMSFNNKLSLKCMSKNRKVDLSAHDKYNKILNYSKLIHDNHKSKYKSINNSINYNQKNKEYWINLEKKIENNNKIKDKFLIEAKKKKKINLKNKNNSLNYSSNNINQSNIDKFTKNKEKLRKFWEKIKFQNSKIKKVEYIDKILDEKIEISKESLEYLKFEIDKYESIINNKSLDDDENSLDNKYFKAIKAKLKILENYEDNITHKELRGFNK